MPMKILIPFLASHSAVASGTLALSLLLAAGASAQNPTTPSYLPKDEPVRLEAFQVDQQRGDQTYTVDRSFSATKTDTPLVNVPQAISVVTRELIDDQSMRNLGDVTRYVPGVGIAQGEGNRDTPVLRGNSTTADFFVDGVRDDAQYFRELYNLDRVEILKGPNALIFGRGGSGGLINRVTKQARGVPLHELNLQFGSWDQYRATVDLGSGLADSLAYRVTALYEDTGSYRDGVSIERYGINPTFAWIPGSRTNVRVGYEHFHDERVADRGISSFQGRPLATDASTFFGDPTQSPTATTLDSGFAVIEHAFANGVSLRNHTRFTAYDKYYQNVFPGAVTVDGTEVSISAYRNATDRENLFNQTDVIFPVTTGTVGHQLLTGLELGRQTTDNLRMTGYFTSVSPTTTSIRVPVASPRSTLPVTFQPSATDASNHGVAETVALYVQDQITFSSQWQAILGARWEQFDVDFLNNRTGDLITSRDDSISPRAGLIFKPRENVSLYASYSMSYVPRAGEQLSSLNLNNRALDPEEFRNHEIGVKWDLRPDLALSAALYQLDRTNVVITDPNDATRSLLVDGQRARGLELGLTGRLSDRWSIVGGYAYQDGEIKTTQSASIVAGSRLAQLPRHTASLWNRYDLNSRWGFGLGVIYRDAIFASTNNEVELPGFVRWDAAVFYRFSENLRAQLNVENVFDRVYFASAHNNNNITPGSPRALRLSLTTRF